MAIDLLVLAVAPIIAFIFWIYLKDKYEKEPIKILAKYFILGAFISIFAIIIEKFLMKINPFTGWYNYIYVAFILAGLTEEGLKALVIIPSLLKEKEFNEKLDGIIYSIFLSLGFATIENLIYILFEDRAFVFEVGLSRAIISIPGHIMFAITMGYYISKYKFTDDKIKKREYFFMSVIVPILLHGVFDFILIIGYRWAIILFIIYIVFLWKINLDKLDHYTYISKLRFLKRKKKNKKDKTNRP